MRIDENGMALRFRRTWDDNGRAMSRKSDTEEHTVSLPTVSGAAVLKVAGSRSVAATDKKKQCEINICENV